MPLRGVRSPGRARASGFAFFVPPCPQDCSGAEVKRYLVIDDFDMRNNFGYRFIQTAQCFNEANYHQARYALKLQESL